MESDLELIKKLVRECLKPHYPVYVNGHTLLLHRRDLGDGWGLVKLSMLITSTDWKPNWKIEVYNKPNEYRWKVILGGRE